MMSAETDSPFGNLPVEMKSKLFTFLNNDARKNARLVCRAWRPIVTEMLTFRAIVTDETEKWIQDCGYQLEALSLKNLSKPIHMSSYFKKFPEIQNYTLGPGNSSQNILNFLRYFPSNMQNLAIQNLTFSKLKEGTLTRALRGIEWSNLSSLSLALKSKGIMKSGMKEEYENHFQAVNEIFLNVRVKTLRNFALELSTCSQKPWFVIFMFILEHWESLRELKLSLFGKPIANTFYSGLSYYDRTHNEMKSLKLQKFCLEHDVYHSIFAQSLCRQMHGLENLDYQGELRMMSKPNIEIEDDKYFAKTLHNHLQNSNFEHTIGLRASSLNAIRFRSHYISLNWPGSFVNLKSIELRILEIRFFCIISYFPVLTKFSIFCAKKPPGKNFATLFTDRVVQRMPNAEELELIFVGTPCFQIHHVQDLRDLKNLRKLTIGTIPTGDIALELYCDETPGLSFRRQKWESMPELSVQTPFECAVIHIDNSKLLSRSK